MRKFAWIIALIFSAVLLAFNASATVLHVETVQIDSFGGVIRDSPRVYAGSIIRYNITLTNRNHADYPNLVFQVVVLNPEGTILDNSTFILTMLMDSNGSVASTASNPEEWKLIYADTPGIYQLRITSLSEHQLFENRTRDEEHFTRHDYSLPFFFEVLSPQNYWQANATSQSLILTQESVKLAQESTAFNRSGLFISMITLLIATIALLLSDELKRHPCLKVLIAIASLAIVVWLLLFIFGIWSPP